MPLRDVLVTLVVFGSIPFILYRPHLGILMWCWLGFMNPHRLAWGFAIQFPFAQVIAIATLLGWLFSREPKRFPFTRESLVLLLFALWTVVTTAFALVPEGAWPQADKVWKVLLLVFATMMLMGEKNRLDALIWLVVLSIGFYGVKGGVFTLLGGGNYWVFGPSGSFIGGNNEIGMALIMTVPLMRYLQLRSSRRWVKHGLTAAMVLSTFAVLGTQSRGALVGSISVVLFLIWKSRKRLILAPAAVLVFVAAVSFMPQHWFERMESILHYEEDGSAQGRINAWWFAFNLARDRPVLGGGFETFTPYLFYVYAPDPENTKDAHSIYFEVLGEHGFVGLGIFLLLGLLSWRGCSQTIKQARDDPEVGYLADLAKMVQVSLVGYASCGAFLGLAYFDLYYNLIAIVVISKQLVKERLYELEEQEDESEETLIDGRRPVLVP